MKTDCDMIRDLLPLYADEVCSDTSRLAVEEHLRDCPACAAELEKLRSGELEAGLKEEKDQVLRHQAKRFRRRSAAVGSVIAGVFMIPVLVCLIVNLASGAALDWFFIVLGGLAVAASLVIVPLVMPEDKLFWTFCAFTVSLMFLLAVCCFYSGGQWFFTVASAVLFGLSAAFLPFLIKARPVRRLTEGMRRWAVVLAVDLILFANMMNMITLQSKSVFKTGGILLLCAAGAWFLVTAVRQKNGGAK